MSDQINASIASLNHAIGVLQGTAATNTTILQDIRQDLIRHFVDDKEAFDEMNKRIGGIEKKVWWFSGVGACIAFVAAKLTGKF